MKTTNLVLLSMVCGIVLPITNGHSAPPHRKTPPKYQHVGNAAPATQDPLDPKLQAKREKYDSPSKPKQKK